MTIKRYAGDKLVGLSSDTKPTNIPDGATFYETDTLTPFLLVSGSWSEVGGGGTALELYAENPVTPTAPTATATNSAAIGSGADATGNNSFAIGTNTTASGGGSLAIGYAASATTSISQAIGAAASGAGSQAVEGGATAIGGSYASGTDSFAAAIADNTSSYGATGANAVAMGYRSKASGSYGFAVGYQNIASGTYSVALGRNTTSAGAQGFAAGYLSEAAAVNSTAFGFRSKTRVEGQLAVTSGYFAAAGDAQSSIYTFRSDTADATAEALTTDNSTASTDNQIILPNNSAYSFSGTIIARQQASAGSNYASWEIKGALLRDANAASTVLGNGIINKLFATAGAAAWDIDLTADTTNGGLAITVTGAAATSIRWVATINTSEVTYA